MTYIPRSQLIVEGLRAGTWSQELWTNTAYWFTFCFTGFLTQPRSKALPRAFLRQLIIKNVLHRFSKSKSDLGKVLTEAVFKLTVNANKDSHHFHYLVPECFHGPISDMGFPSICCECVLLSLVNE